MSSLSNLQMLFKIILVLLLSQVLGSLDTMPSFQAPHFLVYYPQWFLYSLFADCGCVGARCCSSFLVFSVMSLMHFDFVFDLIFIMVFNFWFSSLLSSNIEVSLSFY